MRYIGAVFVIASLLFTGISKASECKKCCKTLRNSILMLNLLKNEICTARTPVNRIMSKAAAGFQGEVSQFAEMVCKEIENLGEKDFSEIWSNSANKSLLSIPNECLCEIFGLGTSIGRYNAELQALDIDRCSNTLNAYLANYQPELKNKQKMYIGLYGGIGMIVAVVLI